MEAKGRSRESFFFNLTEIGAVEFQPNSLNYILEDAFTTSKSVATSVYCFNCSISDSTIRLEGNGNYQTCVALRTV